MLKRNREVLLWLSEEELKELKDNAKKCGLSVQAYLRMILKNIQPREKPNIDFYETLKVLRQISINMNQIAVKANSIGFIDVNAYWDNSHKVMEVAGELKQQIMQRG